MCVCERERVENGYFTQEMDPRFLLDFSIFLKVFGLFEFFFKRVLE